MKLKERIIQKIQQVENPLVLEEVELWLDAVLKEGDSFSSNEIDAVKKEYSQYLQDDLHKSSEVEEIYNKWAEGK